MYVVEQTGFTIKAVLRTYRPPTETISLSHISLLQRHHNDSRAIKVVWPNIGKCRILRHLVVYGTNVFQRLVEECGIATHYSNCRRDTTPRADIIAWLRTITLEGDPHIGKSSSHHLVREQLKAIRGFCHFHRASYKGY